MFVKSLPRGTIYNMNNYSGFFLTLEGGEGAGKSTLLASVLELLKKDIEIIHTREPGGSSLGGKLRDLLLHEQSPINPRSELLLFLADRAEHVQETIAPALSRGALVVCDRFTESTLAYQGYGRGMSIVELQPLLDFASLGLDSDLVALLDIPVHIGHNRVAVRGKKDRIESLGEDFHVRVRDGFLELAKAAPDRFCVLSGLDTPETNTQKLVARLPARFVA
jgi:dTMP kinase